MNPEILLGQQKNILEQLSMLPRKILSLHGQDNITEFVLHELCHERCFNIDKAAYFIDNPDFDCIKGVAGHCRQTEGQEEFDIWHDPVSFTNRMKESDFNKKVREVVRESSLKRKKDEKETIALIAQDLNLSRHGFYSWPMKHDNHGIFIYERAADNETNSHDLFLPEGVTLLGFCPVF